MPKIKDVIDGMQITDLQPTPPTVVPSVVSDELDKTIIEQVALILVQPWKYGSSLHRISDAVGLSLLQVKRIKREIERRLREVEVVE
jgi:hypothetical protein